MTPRKNSETQSEREREFFIAYERIKKKPPVIIRYKPMPTPMDYRERISA